MTDLDTTRLRELHEKATKAPWEFQPWSTVSRSLLDALDAAQAEVEQQARQLDAVKALADECRTKAKDRETMAMGAYAFGQAAQGNEWAGHAAVLLAFAERLDAITDTEKGA